MERNFFSLLMLIATFLCFGVGFYCEEEELKPYYENACEAVSDFETGYYVEKVDQDYRFLTVKNGRIYESFDVWKAKDRDFYEFLDDKNILWIDFVDEYEAIYISENAVFYQKTP